LKQDITFFSEGTPIVGDLYLPENIAEEQKLPAVVLCHGFAGIKEILLPAYAKKFAQNGFAALIFDYRGFGASEGERGRLVPGEQTVDIRNAITFMQTLSEVDGNQIGLWGTSFGGANAMYVAAIDPRVKAISVQLTFASGAKMVKGDLDEAGVKKLESTLKKVRERAVVKNKMLKLGPEQILTDEESKAFFVKIIEQHPELRVKIPVSTLQHIIEHNPQDVIGKVTCPIVIIAAEQDQVCPPEESDKLFELANEPKKLVSLACQHYDAYEGDSFETGSDAAVEWLSTYLK